VDSPELLAESLNQLALSQPILAALGIDSFENLRVIHCSQVARSLPPSLTVSSLTLSASWPRKDGSSCILETRGPVLDWLTWGRGLRC
jgi:hypothetical protein